MAPPRNSSTATGVSLGPDLAALLARVEAAEGRDVALDGAIHRALFPSARALIDPGDMRSGRPGVYGTIAELSYLGDRDLADYIGVSVYTASLDAALALCERVLPGCRWRLYYLSDGERAIYEPATTAFAATCGLPGEQEGGQGQTAPLAMLAALLNALIAQGEDGTARSSQPIREDHP